jgi:hypothetical protein
MRSVAPAAARLKRVTGSKIVATGAVPVTPPRGGGETGGRGVTESRRLGGYVPAARQVDYSIVGGFSI